MLCSRVVSNFWRPRISHYRNAFSTQVSRKAKYEFPYTWEGAFLSARLLHETFWAWTRLDEPQPFAKANWKYLSWLRFPDNSSQRIDHGKELREIEAWARLPQQVFIPLAPMIRNDEFPGQDPWHSRYSHLTSPNSNHSDMILGTKISIPLQRGEPSQIQQERFLCNIIPWCAAKQVNTCPSRQFIKSGGLTLPKPLEDHLLSLCLSYSLKLLTAIASSIECIWRVGWSTW